MRFDLPWRKTQPSEPLAVPAKATQSKSSAAARGIAIQAGGAFPLSARDNNSLTRLGYQSNPVGFRAVRMVIEAAAALPLVVQDAAQRYETHRLLSLITRPNAAQTRQNEVGEILLIPFGNPLHHGFALGFFFPKCEPRRKKRTQCHDQNAYSCNPPGPGLGTNLY